MFWIIEVIEAAPQQNAFLIRNFGFGFNSRMKKIQTSSPFITLRPKAIKSHPHSKDCSILEN